MLDRSIGTGRLLVVHPPGAHPDMVHEAQLRRTEKVHGWFVRPSLLLTAEMDGRSLKAPPRAARVDADYQGLHLRDPFPQT